MYGTTRGTQWGYSLWSFEVFGPGGVSALPRTGWTASASVSSTTDVPANMLDGNTSTRWSTGIPMANGQTITIDMAAPHTVSQITMDSAGSTNDYARGYQVSLSTDATTWTAVASGSGTSALVTVTFTPSTARYIRVTQTGSASSWWSIAEFNAYGS
jgi:beta-glucosidase